MTIERDPYAVLGVSADATLERVAAAYRRLARRHHPDVSRDQDAQRRMAEINAAWAILRDPAARAAWDRAHGVHRGVAHGPGGARIAHHRAGSGRVARPWETPAGGRGPVAWRRGPNGEGAAGPPPGNPRGTVLPFGRHIGWSLGEVARVDPGYLVWLAGRREGAPYVEEIATLVPEMQSRGGLSGSHRTPGRRSFR